MSSRKSTSGKENMKKIRRWGGRVQWGVEGIHRKNPHFALHSYKQHRKMVGANVERQFQNKFTQGLVPFVHTVQKHSNLRNGQLGVLEKYGYPFGLWQLIIKQGEYLESFMVLKRKKKRSLCFAHNAKHLGILVQCEPRTEVQVFALGYTFLSF